MYLKRLEVVKLSGVPLIDYWIKIPQWWGLASILLIAGGLSALWAGATFWAWHTWLLFFTFLYSGLVAWHAWRLQAPRELRPRFTYWFVFLGQIVPAGIVGGATVLWYREIWTIFWAPAWCVMSTLVSFVVTMIVNSFQKKIFSSTIKK